MSRYRYFTPEELDYIDRHYIKQPAERIAKRLARPEHSIHYAANYYGLGRLPKSETPVADLVPLTGLTYKAIARAAANAGALRRHGRQKNGRARLVTVKNTWAKELLDNLPTERKTALEAAGWLSAQAASDYLGISTTTLHNALRGKGHLADLLAGARTATARGDSRPGVYLHPQDVEAARDALARQRRLVRDGVTLKALAIETGLTPTGVTRRLKALGITPTTAYASGALHKVVTREEAERVLGYQARPQPAQRESITPRDCEECGSPIPTVTAGGYAYRPGEYKTLRFCNQSCSGRNAARSRPLPHRQPGEKRPRRQAWPRPGTVPYRIVQAVSEYDGLPLTTDDLVDVTGATRSTVQTELSRLVKAGLVQRQRTREHGTLITAPERKAA